MENMERADCGESWGWRELNGDGERAVLIPADLLSIGKLMYNIHIVYICLTEPGQSKHGWLCDANDNVFWFAMLKSDTFY